MLVLLLFGPFTPNPEADDIMERRDDGMTSDCVPDIPGKPQGGCGASGKSSVLNLTSDSNDSENVGQKNKIQVL